jgi:hypothetical protein
LFLINPTYGFIENNANYSGDVAALLSSGLRFMGNNLIEWALLSVGFTYFFTRRKFWLKAKTMVADYESPVLLKSMNMDK